MPDNPLIFISYATPDRDRVVPYHDALSAKGYDVWIDYRRIKAGQIWDFEIKRALDKATLILIFISTKSIDRRGYVQREIKIALDKAAEKLADDIYVIPILLDDDAEIPEQIKHLQAVRASDSDKDDRIEDAIRHQLEKLGENVAEAQERLSVRWSSTHYRDAWDGLPGYECEFQVLNFSSDQYPQVSEITDIIKGSLVSDAMELRFTKFNQDTESYDFGQERYSRTNTWEAFAGEPKIAGRIISIVYRIGWYFCGAAHPNSGFRTFCFLLDPLVRIARLSTMFADEQKSLETLKALVRRQLLAPKDDDEGLSQQEETVLSGTEEWDSFGSFAFDEEGMEIMFAPYQVASYANGPQFVRLPYKDFAHLLLPLYKNALGQHDVVAM